MTLTRTPRSSNWRVNSSSIKSVEGAHILRALKKVAGAAGLPSHKKVRFNTNAYMNATELDVDLVRIDAGDLFTKAPMPPENMDILVGRTLHEVEHYIINSSGVWSSSHYRIIEAERAIFQDFVNIGEDIIIDHRLNANTNLKDYHESAVDKLFAGRRSPQFNNLLEVWIEYSLAHNPAVLDFVPREIKVAFAELLALNEKIVQPMERLTGTRLRADYYLATWDKVRDIVLHPPELPEDAQSCSDGHLPQESLPGDKESPGRTMPGPTDKHFENAKEREKDLPLMNMVPAPIDQRLAEAIEEAMTTDTEDITRQVYNEFEEAGYMPKSYVSFVVTRKHETKTIIVKPDPEQCRKLERILTIRKRLQARVMRGENYGKLDMKKLHRSQTDQRMFKLKYRFPDGFPECAILVDMSGSMTGTQAEEVIVAATSLAQVVKCKVWSYAEQGSEIKLVKLDDGKFTHKSSPCGNTPSGIALVGVADTLKPGGLVIHLTDGEHNVEFGPAEAVQVLNHKGINAVHLLWGKNFGPYEGLPCKVLTGGLAEFPEALYWILVEQLQLAGLGLPK
jgi:hypothetical protein